MIVEIFIATTYITNYKILVLYHVGLDIYIKYWYYKLHVLVPSRTRYL